MVDIPYPGEDYLAIDIDTRDDFFLLKSFFNALNLFPSAKIECYATRHGYHVIIYGVRSDLGLRATLGDDPDRIEWAEKIMKLTKVPCWDMIFHVKTFGGSTFRSYKLNPLSLQWFTKLPRGYWKEKLLKLHRKFYK